MSDTGRPTDDLRGFIAALERDHPRELLTIDTPLDGNWELAACTAGLEQRLRVPLIRYSNVTGSDFTVVHNVCSSLARIARVVGCSVAELERRCATAYDRLVPPRLVDTGPVRDVCRRGDAVDLGILPRIRYSEGETRPYLSAACVVARDARSDALNISFNRLMIAGSDTLAIYMSEGSDLERIWRSRRDDGRDTPVAVFIGSHPLWSLGSLSAGPLELDEFEVIGGLLGVPLPVVAGLEDDTLRIPAHAEFALEGVISRVREIDEGPYGEAFGYVSRQRPRPALQIRVLSHRRDALFQDIVPARIEHMTMTALAIRVHLQKTLLSQFDCIESLFLPTAMTVHLAIRAGTARERIRAMLEAVVTQQRYVKHAVAFDAGVALDNQKQTQRALALHVQADRDVLIVPDQTGNGLDPSERGGRTTKWAIDATEARDDDVVPVANRIPDEVLERIDVGEILDRARSAGAGPP